MVLDHNSHDLANAIEDFRRARNQADLKELLSLLTGESNQLLSYDDVRKMLKLQGGLDRGVQDIPLDAIVGSVGRYTDFTRDFLPRREVQPERWARVRSAASSLVGLPPIDVYKIGEVYFVQDGNHRVSVARQLGAKYIQAYVTEVRTRVPLTPDVKPDELILMAEYSQFLEQTHLDQLRPDSDLRVTVPGQYPILLEHIDVHRYFMGIDFNRMVDYEEAVTHWYDQVYMPIVKMIREKGLLREFPNRTETDLYLWISEHRTELEAELGFPVRTEFILDHLAEEHRPNWISRLGGQIADLVVPDEMEGGAPLDHPDTPPEKRFNDRLFIDVLVPINGKEDGWCALEQAIRVARRDSARLHGLHVFPSERESVPDKDVLQDEFNRRCAEGGVAGNLIFAGGEVVEQTCLRASATDLVVVNLSYPPGAQPISRLASGFRNLITRCPRPVLATPQTVSELNHALLAFDGSPKAREALFIAAYVAQKWQIPLDVVTIQDSSRLGEKTLQQAKDYLQKYEIQGNYFLEAGEPGNLLLEISQKTGADWVIMGGYGLNPVLEVVLGSTVDKILRHSEVPTLICR